MSAILILTATIISLCYYIARKHFKFWEHTKVKCLTPPTLLGAIRGSFFVTLPELYSYAPEEPYVGITTLSSPAMSIRDPDLIRVVLTNQFDCFLDRGMQKFNEKWDPLSANLFLVEGQRWKSLRSKMTAGFSSAKLRTFFQLTKTCVDQLVSIVTCYADKEEAVDMSKLVSLCTVDIILTTAFGVQGNSMREPENMYVKLKREHFKVTPFKTFYLALLQTFPFLVNVIPPEQGRKDENRLFLEPFLVALGDRKKNDIAGNSYIHYLLDTQRKEMAQQAEEGDAEITDKIIGATLWGFFLAGSDSTANTTAFCIVELANNIAIQDKVRKEANEAIERNGGLTYDAVKDMKYLEQVVSETLRLYPTVTTLKRMVSKEFTMPDGRVTLPVGTRILINIRKLHRDPKYYAEPDKFDPNNFSPEAKQDRHKFVYLPFGDGPRNCVGWRLALNQIKLIVASLVSQFEIRPKEGIPYPPVLSTKTINYSLMHGAPVFFVRLPSKV